MKKYPRPELNVNTNTDFSNVKIEVEEKIVGEMWTIGADKDGNVTVLKKIKAIRENNENVSTPEGKKPKYS